MRLFCIGLTLACGSICLLLGLIVIGGFDFIINPFIDKEIEIKNGSDMYGKWVEPPVVPYLKVYFFNMTNSEDFLLKKVKPIFKEVGPYTYREKWRKVNISFHDNHTVSYATKKDFFFERSMSSGSEDDIIHSINVPVTVAVEKISSMSRIFQLFISSLLITLNETVFVDKSVRDLLWGYEDPLIKIAEKYLPKEQQLPFDKFGFFYQRNGSTEGLFNVRTGMKDITKLSTITSLDHQPALKYWKSRECNMINGTDGTSYPPYVKKTSTLYMFNKNLCRSIALVYNRTVDHSGISNYRFTPSSDVFASVSKNPENSCYCVDGPPCIGGGVFNISACRYNVSTILSWPHFYNADAKYLDAVVGLQPEASKHGFFVDVNPRLGTPMGAQARLQINFYTSNSSTIKIMKNMTSMVFPVLWFEDGVLQLPPDMVDLIGMASNVPSIAKLVLLCVFFVAGISCIFFAGLCYWQKKKSQSTLVLSPSTGISSTESEGHVNKAISPENPD